MTNAQIRINAPERTLYFRADGHADFAEAGRDIVCASVSILAYTLAETVAAACGAERLENDANITIDDGVFDIKCTASDDEAFGELAMAFSFAGTGFSLLENQYPDNVHIDFEIQA